MKSRIKLLLLCACLANMPNASADQFTTNLNYLVTNTQGQPDIQTHAQSTYEHTKSKTTQLNKPKITLFAKQQQHWVITAETGEIQTLIHLKNHVRLKNPTTTLITNELTINPQTRELITHAPITISAKTLKEPLHAQAQTTTYTQATGKITLQHQALIKHSKHTLTGETLIYDTKKQTLLSAPNNPHNKEPITMVIQPDA